MSILATKAIGFAVMFAVLGVFLAIGSAGAKRDDKNKRKREQLKDDVIIMRNREHNDRIKEKLSV